MINLLPYKEKKIIERIRNVRLMQTLVVGIICLSFVCAILLIPTLLTTNSRFNIFSNQVSMLEQSGMMASDIDLASLNKRAQIVQSKLAISVESQPTDYINIVKPLTSKGVSIQRFVMTENKLLEVSGIVESREVLQDFIHTLETNENVALVDSPVSNFVKSKNSDFKITVSFK